MSNLRLAVCAAAAALALLSPRQAAAGAITIYEHSAGQLGLGYAGAAAAAEDASTIADNPAGIARLDVPQLVASGTFVAPQVPFTNTGSRLPTGAPIGGPNDDGGGFVPLPNAFLSSPIGGGLSVGLGVFPSFGLATEYRRDWVGRYNAISSDVTSIDVAPTLAYRILPGLSVGISPVARYTKIKFTNAIDFGSIGAGLGVPGAVPGGNDGSVKIKVSGYSFALNGGILFEPTATTRLGLAYFHNEAAKVDGSAAFNPGGSVGDLIAAASGAFVDTGARSTIALPDHLNIGIVQAITPQIDIRAGATWTQWSRFKEERIVFANPAQPNALMVEDWHDTVMLALGGSWHLRPDLVLRAGFSYDETPIPDAQHRDPRLPDTNRYGVSIGAGYEITPSLGADFAYEHLFGETVGLVNPTATGDVLVGKGRLSADLVAVQLRVRY